MANLLTASSGSLGSGDTHPHVLLEAFDNLKSILTCNICVRPMYEPYTIHCGHTFCYSCLVAWFEKNPHRETCPECRAKVQAKPAPSFTIREMTRVFFNKPELLGDDETVEEHTTAQEQERELVEKHKAGQDGGAGLFPGSFITRHRHPIRDDSDGVDRCPQCTWELEEGWCYQCDIDWDGSDSYPESFMFDEDDDFPDSDSLSESDFDPRSLNSPNQPPPRPPYTITASEAEDFHNDGIYDDFYDEEQEEDNSLDGFIDHDDVEEYPDDQSEPDLGSPNPGSVTYGHNDMPPLWDDDRLSSTHVEDEDSDGSSTTQNPRHFFARNHSVELGPGSMTQSEMDNASDTSDSTIDRRLNPVESSSDELEGNEHGDETANNVDESDDSESQHAPSVSLTLPRGNRKRRRVLESDSDDDDEDMPAARPVRRRLSHQRHASPRTTSPVPDSDSDQFSANGSSSSLHEGNRPARRSIPRHTCHRPNARHDHRPVARNSPRRHIQRPFQQNGPSGSSTQRPHGRYALDAISTIPPPPPFDVYGNAHRYNDFVQGWTMQPDNRHPAGDRGIFNAQI